MNEGDASMASRAKFQNRDAERHLKALGLSTYALTFTGLLYRGPCHAMPLSELLDGLDEVARRNKKAFQHVFIHGADDDDHDLVLLGPTQEPFTDELKAAGYDPAAVVHVGPGHVETWLRLGESVPRATRQSIAAYLNWAYGVSVLPKQGLKFGYLAGFECRAYEESLRNGHYPRIKLLEATGAVASRGRTLIETVEELDAEMRAAIECDLLENIEAERAIAEAEEASREFDEHVAKCAGVWLGYYQGQGLHACNEIDRTEVQAAFEHDVARDLVVEALTHAAIRKGSGARAYAEATVAAVYDLGSDDPSPDLEPS
jgi:hypothetical protein